MVVGVFIAVGLLYAALTWGYVALIYDPAHVQKAPLAQMGKALAGAWGLRLVIATVAVSIFGGAIANGMGLSRRLVALEEGGSLPVWFGKIGSRGVPRNAVLFVFAVLAVLAVSGGFTALAILAVTSRVLIYLSCLIALPVIRRRRARPMFETSDALVLPAIPVCVFLLSRSAAWLPVAAAVLAGFLVLFIARRLRSRQLIRSVAVA
jgi:amino acid transporter